MRILCNYTVKWLRSGVKRREAVRSGREAAAKPPRSRREAAANQCEALRISVQPKHSLTMCGRPSVTGEAL